MTLFVGYLVDTKKKSTTIRSYISAIKTVLLSENIKLKEDKYLINSLIQGCRYVNDIMMPRLPIKKHLLRIILDTTYSIFTIVNNQPYLSYLYRAMFSTAYYGLFRVGELAKGEHLVLVQDIYIATNKNKILFILRTLKTHWKDNRPQQIKISSSGDGMKTHCPFKILREFLNVRPNYGNGQDPIFVFSDGEVVNPNHINAILKLILNHAGFNEKLYSMI